jgi:hypothetical protein
MLDVMKVCGPAEPDRFSIIICAVSAIRSVGRYTDCCPRTDRRSSPDKRPLPLNVSTTTNLRSWTYRENLVLMLPVMHLQVSHRVPAFFLLIRNSLLPTYVHQL